MDLDGTLLDSESRISAANIEAIREARERGIEIVIVTGRRFHSARMIAEPLPDELHLIVNNGALIKSKAGETHQRHLLPKRTARRLLDATEEFRAYAAVVFDRPKEKQVVLERVDFEDPVRGGYFRRSSQYVSAASPLTRCLNGEDPIQVMYLGPCEVVRSAKGAIERLPFRDEYSIALAEYEDRELAIMDVVPAGVTKGTALAEWAGRRGIAREDVMAIGDNWNDRQMLEFAGVPVVMENCVAGLKSCGWNTTLSNDRDGVAAAIRKYALTGTDWPGTNAYDANQGA